MRLVLLIILFLLIIGAFPVWPYSGAGDTIRLAHWASSW
jgi:Protein of unknown function (DUF3309)